MISGNIKMFPIELADVADDIALPFPVYLHLVVNHRYVPVPMSNHPLGKEKLGFFAKSNVKQFWIPETYRKQYEEYMRGRKAPAPPPAPEPEVKLSEPDKEGIFEETELVSEVIQDDNLSAAAKAEILASLGQDLLRSFNQISNRGAEGQQEAIKRGRQIADEILAIAAQDSNIYGEILNLRQSKQDIEHSIMVSTLSVMFGLALGYSDEIALADLAVAGLFHDIGLTRIDPMILAKPEVQWSAQDRMRYHEHVFASIDILKSAKGPYPEVVYTMISQHHENYDGSGFPKQLSAMKITESSQLLHLANWFDRLTSGKLDGLPLSPNESIDKMFKDTVNPKAVKEIQPELIQRVFQFMLDEKEAAETLLKEAAERSQFVNAKVEKAG